MYSGGMWRRLDITASIVVTSDLLFWTSRPPVSACGIYPRSRRSFGHSSPLGQQWLTTQYLDEADRLADRIVVIDEGWIELADVDRDDVPDQLVEQRYAELITTRERTIA